MSLLHIGIDLGGTKIESVVLDSNNQIIFRERVTTESHLGAHHIIKRINFIYQKALKVINNQPHTLGMGTPGSISETNSVLINSNTLCLNGLPLKDLVQTEIDHQIEIENDANCFALAEAILGSGKKHSMVFGVIMGTGCGGGFVFNQRLRKGPQNLSGEWGHAVINPNGPQCYCGKKGCVETYISGGGLENKIKDLTQKEITSRAFLNQATYNKNEKNILDEFYQYFGLALSNIINSFDPDVIVLGGGLSNHQNLYNKGLDEIYKNIFNDKPQTPILKNTLGDSAGVIGAAMLGIKLNKDQS
ncbi:MAG: ROK family protein [Methylophilaceae bacterium]